MIHENCQYCKDIFGIKKHNIQNCPAKNLHENNTMFCWLCHRINEYNNFENIIVHWHTTEHCSYVCKNKTCKMNHILHSVYDCNLK